VIGVGIDRDLRTETVSNQCQPRFCTRALALTRILTLGAITPLGGVAFIAAWLLLAYRVSAR